MTIELLRELILLFAGCLFIFGGIKEKDGQIALLSEEVRRRSEEIIELTKAFREAQALHAGTMQRELTDNNKRKWWKFWK